MHKRTFLSAVAAAALAGAAAVASAQTPQQMQQLEQKYPMLGKATQAVIQKYQTHTCAQIAADKGGAKTPVEQKMIDTLRQDPQLRTAFLSKVAPTIANKLFDCGMIP